MGYAKGKGKQLQEEVSARTVEYRQKMLNYFKKSGGATFSEMNRDVYPDATAPKLSYHFYELKETGYIKQSGLKKVPGIRACKLWIAVKEKYVYEPSLAANNPIEKIPEEQPYTKPVYVNGICTVRMRHTTRRENRTGKVNIGSSFNMI